MKSLQEILSKIKDTQKQIVRIAIRESELIKRNSKSLPKIGQRAIAYSWEVLEGYKNKLVKNRPKKSYTLLTPQGIEML